MVLAMKGHLNAYSLLDFPEMLTILLYFESGQRQQRQMEPFSLHIILILKLTIIFA